MNRTERQKLGIKRWLESNGTGTFCWCTGAGKTYGSIMIIEMLLSKEPNLDILIVVPTQVLKDQWMNDYIIPRNLVKNCRIAVINTAIKSSTTCDLLIIDECHRVAAETFSSIFESVEYSMILCLTATLERLDGKEYIIKKYAPVCDVITLKEAEKEGWVCPVTQYCVLLDVDLTEYNELSRVFNGCFAFFNYSFDDAMKASTNLEFRKKYAKLSGFSLKEITANAIAWRNAMQKRKTFVQSHPRKLEIAKKILDARKDKKCITFSATIKDAESIGVGLVLHSKKSKKENEKTIETFNKSENGILNSSKAADQGLDIKGLSVGIILSTDSSKIRSTQRIGRVCRFEPNKQAEMFTLVIKGTSEVGWFNNSSTGHVITINEQQLDDVLNGKKVNTREHTKITNIDYRF